MHDQTMPDQGNPYGGVYGGETAAVDPNPPRTEALHMLQQELEQRHSEAMSKRDYHAGEAQTWQSVAQACEQALKSISAPQKTAEGGF